MARCTNLVLSVLLAVLVYTLMMDDGRYHEKFVYDRGYIEMCHVNSQTVPTSIPEAMKYLANRETNREAYFFVETSCLGRLNALEACAVESAAALHPEADIYVILISPPEDSSVSSHPGMQTLVKFYNNVHVLYVHFEDFIRDSVLEKWYNSGGLNKVLFQQSFMKALLRHFSAWKFGGTVVDLDILLMKSLKGLNHFVGAQYNFIVPGVLNFGSAHSPIAYEFLKQVTDINWQANNTDIMERFIHKVCGTKEYERLCNSFLIMPSNAFYPHKAKWKRSNSSHTELKIRGISNLYGIHAWNNKFSTGRRNFQYGPRQFYTLIAQQFCPKVYKNNGNIF